MADSAPLACSSNWVFRWPARQPAVADKRALEVDIPSLVEDNRRRDTRKPAGSQAGDSLAAGRADSDIQPYPGSPPADTHRDTQEVERIPAAASDNPAAACTAQANIPWVLEPVADIAGSQREESEAVQELGPGNVVAALLEETPVGSQEVAVQSPSYLRRTFPILSLRR